MERRHLGRGSGESRAGRSYLGSDRPRHSSATSGSGGDRGRGGQGTFRGRDSRAGFQSRGGFRGRGGSNGESREYIPKPMSYGRLKIWAEMEDAGKLVLFMTSEKQQLETFLNQSTVKGDWFTLLVKAINHAITAEHQKESVRQLLESLFTTRFYDHLAAYAADKQILGYAWHDAEEFFRSMISILEEMLNKLPHSALKCITATSQLLNAAPSAEAFLEQKDVLDALTSLSQRSKEIYKSESERERGSGRGRFVKAFDSDKPPDNFMDLPVVPAEFDLQEDAKPFVRCAKVEGAYEDTLHYLDVQFRLMRQDFILPLRQGIVAFKKSGCKKNFDCSDLRLYFDVNIVDTVFIDGIDHILQFDVSKLKHVKWEFSKRLIFGSLLCLSKDNFETVVFATVAHRDGKELAKGRVSVNFKSGLDVVFNSTSSDVYVMAETTAYFESYSHVLEGLQEMSTKLPLQDYIVKCKKDLKPPRYLLPSGGIHSLPVYDLSCLMKKGESCECSVLTTVRWPSAEVMCLNESQREAAQLALTKEMAIIQGPPGTGKTYVGLKVMQVLMENKEVMGGNDKESTDPVLVVCYTNHALDQFLEGVLEFCQEGVVRVGGKGKSEKLEQFNLRSLKERLRRDQLFSDLSVRKSKFECLKELETVSEEIKTMNIIMDNLETEILDKEVLERYMTPGQCYSLESHEASSKSRQRQSQLKHWLNASGDSPRAVLPKMIQRHLTRLILNWNGAPNAMIVTENMRIADRASLYQVCLEKYRNLLLINQRELLSEPLDFLSGNQLQEIRDLWNLSETSILPDGEIQMVLPRGTLKKMSDCLKSSERRVSIPHGAVVEYWLLGLHRNLHDQLDDIQTLTNLMLGEDPDFEAFDDDDASKQAQNERIIDDDDDNNDESYRNKAKAAKGSFVSVMKRAEMLGIKEEDSEERGQEEWTPVKRTKPLSFNRIRSKLKNVKPMSQEEADAIDSVWELNLDKRFALYNLWLTKYKETLTVNMETLVDRYTKAYQKKKEANREEELFLLRGAKVIGMTTTGAAKHRAVLQAVGCRIIVVEEAAEVLESHIVTALNSRCNHLILIGDHQQLRPSPTVYQLAKDFGLEISLFERLIKNKVPHAVLQEQHRMRPEISRIMRHIYPELLDHSSVYDYDHVRGVSKDIFFVNHAHQESRVDDTRSKANIHEAKYLVALCQYLLNQGYDASQITILATYAGQILAIRKVLKELEFNHRVRVTAVDNFQGEENDIILLSLVRSNAENSVGFLKVDNRICVALSRAKKGLYIIGNFDLLASQSKLWTKIIETVTKDGEIGDGLPVVCQNHPEFEEFMTSEEDFEKRPEGGCGRPCQYRLPCGHVCARKCHGYDPEHTDYKCHKSCPKKCEKGHPCARKCFQDCGECKVPVPKKIPECGHEDQVPCHLPVSKAVCSQRCPEMLECEHQCPGKCGQCRKIRKHDSCQVNVEYSWPCGHVSQVPCYMKPSQYPCQTVCGDTLDCGHKCAGKCSDCLNGSAHAACGQTCDQVLPCGHKCSSFCGVPCTPCTMPCPSQCRDGSCSKAKSPPPCSHACPSCMEKCQHKCKHGSCEKLCSEECSIPPCNKACGKKMPKCIHLCSGLCGELCVCAECEQIKSPLADNAKGQESSDKEVKSSENNEIPSPDSTESDSTGMKKSGKGQKIEARLIIKLPSCFHVFYVDELDKYISNFDPQDCSFIGCPICFKPIQKCMRYEKVNRERRQRREVAKARLLKNNQVSKQEIMNLQLSQSKLEDSHMLAGFRARDVSRIVNRNEMIAASFQVKCAFILSEISSLEKSDGADMVSSELLRSRKDAILKIRDRLTDQQKNEFTAELLRCFWLAYLTHLEMFRSVDNILIPVNLEMQMKESKEKLSHTRPEKEILERAQLVAAILRRRIEEMALTPTVKAKCLLLEDTAARAVKVMRSRDDEMLTDLLKNKDTEKTADAIFSRPVPKVAALQEPTSRLSSMEKKALDLLHKRQKSRLSSIFARPGVDAAFLSARRNLSTASALSDKFSDPWRFEAPRPKEKSTFQSTKAPRPSEKSTFQSTKAPRPREKSTFQSTEERGLTMDEWMKRRTKSHTTDLRHPEESAQKLRSDEDVTFSDSNSDSLSD